MAQLTRGQRRHEARQRKEAAQQVDTPTAPATNGVSSRLMALPAELRNRVWTAVFEGWTQKIDHPGRVQRMKGTDKDYSRQPSLLATCKQIYAEAVGIYYSTAIFLKETSNRRGYSCEVDLDIWMKRIGSERAKLVSNLRLQLCQTYWQLGDLYVQSDPADWRVRNYVNNMKAARAIAARHGNHDLVVMGDLWYDSRWGDRVVVWTSEPSETDRELRWAHDEGYEAFDELLEAKCSDVIREDVWNIPHGAVVQKKNAHELYRDLIE
ncbi:hypothetical protein BST61_g9388 [Cercospora zeina]